MGIAFLEREPHGLPPFTLLLLLLLGVGAFWIARRSPRSAWFTMPLLAVLVFFPVVNLAEWLLGTAKED